MNNMQYPIMQQINIIEIINNLQMQIYKMQKEIKYLKENKNIENSNIQNDYLKNDENFYMM